MKTNLEKYQVLLSSNIQRFVPFDNAEITSSLSEKLLGITFFLELKLEEHISKISIVTDKKRNALHRFTNQMSPDKMLLKGFIEFRFSYGPLISIFQ